MNHKMKIYFIFLTQFTEKIRIHFFTRKYTIQNITQLYATTDTDVTSEQYPMNEG